MLARRGCVVALLGIQFSRYLSETLCGDRQDIAEMTGGRTKQVPFVNLVFNMEMVHFLGPRQLCWPIFDLYHVEQISCPNTAK